MGIEEIRRIHNGDKKPKKRGINKVSTKMKCVKVELRNAYPPYLEKNPECAIKSPVCTIRATCVNHKKGRGANVLNQEDWEPSCWSCNTYIESHPGWNNGLHKQQRIT